MTAPSPGPGPRPIPAPDHLEAVRRAVAKVGLGPVEFVMTSRHEQSRLGVVVRRVMVCADAPISVCVALTKGHPISPLIRDSHAFALCAMGDDDRLLSKKFEWSRADASASPNASGSGQGVLAPARMGDPASDPFIALDVDALETGSPIIKRCGWALDCRVLMHLDFETDHELYIGAVVAARECPTGAPGGGANNGPAKKK